uniref:VPS37 C-terminal domain-containing protein n=1 Tax=Phaeomonas parva TaxID=124430 RepID=A0A7S1TPQ4_9STRA|mmetsp:Transcript_10921/g.33231  ORF Transcript_10921/g.33231 Transcript_10921/m.33231 type:complete len:316 (+) Transcript_10921:180-1127(+)
MSWLRGPREEKMDTTRRDAAVSVVLAQVPGASNDGQDADGAVIINVPFVCGGLPLGLTVRVPMSFPNVAPGMIVAGPPLDHLWLDDGNVVVGNPKLQNWFAHYDLVAVISETTAYLQRSPPRMEGHNAERALSPEPMPESNPAMRQRNSSENIFHTPMPAVPAIFPMLDEMTTAEQKRLMEDEVALETFVEELSVVRDYRQLLDETRAANLTAARALLEKEEGILNARDACLILQAELREKARAHEKLAASTSLDRATVKAQLAREADEADEAKEMEGQNLEDGADVNRWTETFLEKAARYHKLNALREMLNNTT